MPLSELTLKPEEDRWRSYMQRVINGELQGPEYAFNIGGGRPRNVTSNIPNWWKDVLKRREEFFGTPEVEPEETPAPNIAQDDLDKIQRMIGGEGVSPDIGTDINLGGPSLFRSGEDIRSYDPKDNILQDLLGVFGRKATEKGFERTTPEIKRGFLDVLKGAIGLPSLKGFTPGDITGAVNVGGFDIGQISGLTGPLAGSPY